MIHTSPRYASLRRPVAALLVVLLTLTGASATSAVGPSDTITTVAGTGIPGYAGDGGPATAAQLNFNQGVAVDTAGNLFIGQIGNSRIRKVDSAGVITTVAGTGTDGHAGDGGPATAAQIVAPRAVAVDAAGNLYITEPLYVRKVDTSGTITTVAGNGTSGYSGDGGPATAAQLWNVEGVTVDAAGNLYLADSTNNRIRKVDSAGTITTVAGNGSYGYAGDGGPAAAAGLNQPYGVALDAAGNLYIGDTSNNRIRKVDSAGTITTVAGTGTAGYSGDGGPAASAQVWQPQGLAVDATGNLYIGDTFNNRVRRVAVNLAGSQIEQLIGDVQALADSGTINGGQSNALITKLNQAAAQVAQQDPQQAINLLHAFINQVMNFMNTGVLTAAEGQPLIDAANAAIHSLGG